MKEFFLKAFKLFNLFFTPLIAVVLVLMQMPLLDGFIKDWPHWVTPALVATYILGTLYLQIFKHIIPAFELRAIKNKFYSETKQGMEELINQYQPFEFGINIMVLSDMNDKNSPNTFKVVLTRGNETDARLKFKFNQGCCGLAYQSKAIKHFDLVDEYSSEIKINKLKVDLNLTDEHLELTKNLKMVASLPIFKIIDRGRREKKEIIGILNVHSITQGSELIVKDNTLRLKLAEKMHNIAKNYALSI